MHINKTRAINQSLRIFILNYQWNELCFYMLLTHQIKMKLNQNKLNPLSKIKMSMHSNISTQFSSQNRHKYISCVKVFPLELLHNKQIDFDPFIMRPIWLLQTNNLVLEINEPEVINWLITLQYFRNNYNLEQN